MRILDIRVDEVDMAAALDFIAAAIEHPRENGCPRQIVTLNPEGLMLAKEDAAFAALLEDADLVTADGTGILWASRQLGHPLPERVTGIDLLQAASARAARAGWRVYLLGAKPGVAETAAERLIRDYPGLDIAGVHHGYFNGGIDAVIAAVNAAEPDILFVALGMPAQERFIAAHRNQLKAALAIGVGGSFDVLAGNVRRAPKLMQRARLEWLWRLMLQPSRLPRMMVIPRFMKTVLFCKKKA